MALPNITNPNPVTASANRLWVSTLFISGKRLVAQLLPYDAALKVVVVGGAPVRVSCADVTKDEVLGPAAAAIAVEVRRQGVAAAVLPVGDTSPLVSVSAFAPNPARPIVAVGVFGTAPALKQVRVNDCEALAAADATFAGVFVNALEAIKAKAS